MKLIINKIKACLLRNNNSLAINKVNKNHVYLEYCDDIQNLGDFLATVIFDWMLEQKTITSSCTKKRKKHLFTVGSVIGFSTFDATIWGSGILSLHFIGVIIKRRFWQKYDIRMVRGPVTRKVLLEAGYDCPEIYGDPAVLMPIIYPVEKVKKKYSVSIILHHAQSKCDLSKNYHTIDIKTIDYKSFIDELILSEKVISSSLHGIILAESYGIPAVFLKEGMDDQLVKFYDWYYSTKRYNIKMAHSLEEALLIEPMPLPNINELQDNLLNTFPYDLWN